VRTHTRIGLVIILVSDVRVPIAWLLLLYKVALKHMMAALDSVPWTTTVTGMQIHLHHVHEIHLAVKHMMAALDSIPWTTTVTALETSNRLLVAVAGMDLRVPIAWLLLHNVALIRPEEEVPWTTTVTGMQIHLHHVHEIHLAVKHMMAALDSIPWTTTVTALETSNRLLVAVAGMDLRIAWLLLYNVALIRPEEEVPWTSPGIQPRHTTYQIHLHNVMAALETSTNFRPCHTTYQTLKGVHLTSRIDIKRR
jgi:hypothetical protein